MTYKTLPILLMAVLAIPFAGMANADTSTITDTFTLSGTEIARSPSDNKAIQNIEAQTIKGGISGDPDRRTVKVIVIYNEGYNPENTETTVTLSNDGKSVSHTFTINDNPHYPRYFKTIDVRSLGVDVGDGLSVKVTTENTHIDSISTNNDNGHKEFQSTSDAINAIQVNNIGDGFSGSNDLRFTVIVNYNENYNAENTETTITFPGHVAPYTLTSDDKTRNDGIYTKLFSLSSSQVNVNQVIEGTVTTINQDTTPDTTPETKKKKSGGGSNDWKVKPTFGKSWETSRQLVENGFTFNNYNLTVTDNWHTDFNKTSSIIGEKNHVELKVYASHNLRSATLQLGVPEIGQSTYAETGIHVLLNRNYTNPNNYDISEIIHEQKEPLLNVNKTIVSIAPSYCNDNSNDKQCHTISFDFTVMAPLKSDVIAIKALDFDRRSTTTYINEGVEFTGQSLLESATHDIYQKSGNQYPMETLTLTQQDRRYQIWEDNNGYLWTQNNYGTWFQITKPDITRHDDPPTLVMTRIHSEFASLILEEQDKATLIFDSVSLQSSPAESFTYEFAENDYSSKLERLSKEFQIEEIKAQAIFDGMEKRYLVND